MAFTKTVVSFLSALIIVGNAGPASAQAVVRMQAQGGAPVMPAGALNLGGVTDTGNLTLPAAPSGLAQSPIAAPTAVSPDLGAPAASAIEAGEGVVRLIVEPPAGDRHPFFDSQDELFLTTAINSLGGHARKLQRGGPGAIFEGQAYVQVDAAQAQSLIRMLEGAGLRVSSLAQSLDTIRSAKAAPASTDEELKAAAEKLFEQNSGALDQSARLGALLGAVESSDMSKLSQDARRHAAVAIQNGLVPTVNAFGAIRGDQEWEVRRSLAGRFAPDDYAGIHKAVLDRLREPGLKAPVEPIRDLMGRSFRALDRLGASAALPEILTLLPQAEHAGLKYLASDPKLGAKYVEAWLASIADSVRETLEGLLLGDQRSKDWTGSERSGGYEHLDGARRSMHLYEWRPFRADPAETRAELPLLLGMPAVSGLPLGDMIVRLLKSVEGRIPEMAAIDQRNTRARELAKVEARIARLRERYAEEGLQIDPQMLQEYRQQLIEDAERAADREKIEGHRVVDQLLASFGFFNSAYAVVPGFDPATYASSVMRLLQYALDALSEPGLVKQLIDTAVSFLVSLAEEPAIVARPQLRTRAMGLWLTISAKAAALKIPLRTRLDGVIDPRPELRPVEPANLPGDQKQWAVWQVAESPDGRYVARVAADRSVLVWETSTGRLVKRIALDDARQFYGDSANSLALSWDAGGKLIVAALHDNAGGKGFHNKIRVFDLAGSKEDLGPADALSEAVIPDVYVLRHMPAGTRGRYLAARVDRYKKQSEYSSSYEGSETRLFAMDGKQLSRIDDSFLLDARGDMILTSAPHIHSPALRLWDAENPLSPRDISPAWMKGWVAEWAKRHPASEYGYWSGIDGRLGDIAGRRALIVHEAGRLHFIDLETGREAVSVKIPNNWSASVFVTDATGRTAAAVVKPEGNLQALSPERLIVWDLASGSIVMERDTKGVQQLAFGRDGKLIAAGTKGVDVYPLGSPASTPKSG